MKYFFTLLVLMLVFSRVNAQGPALIAKRDSLIGKMVHDLRSKGVDTICTFSPYSDTWWYVSHLDNNTTPWMYKTTFQNFVLWRQHGKSYFSYKIDNLEYLGQPLKDERIWAFFAANSVTIDTQKIRPMRVKRVNIDSGTVRIVKPDMRDDSEEGGYWIMMGKKNVKKNFRWMPFRNFDISGGENINYDYNMSLKAKQMELMLVELCRKLVDYKAVVSSKSKPAVN